MAECRFSGEVLRRRGRLFDILEAIDENGRKVAVKRARNFSGSDKPRFERERRLGQTLKHEGLASILGCAPNRIVFEWLEGSLLERPAGTGALATLGNIARTLAHLHACGVVHRDLKPAHVMFRGSHAVLVDLGVAGLVGSTDPLDTGEVVGSPAWMAPEQMLGAAPEPSADIWSLCAIAHRVLSDRPLYAGTADAVLAARRANTEPRPDFSSVADRPLAEMLRAGLTAPSDRPSARDFAEAFAKIDAR